jgi:hypothetical protein
MATAGAPLTTTAITQAGNAMKNLNLGAGAQVAATQGVNTSTNLSKMNAKLNLAGRQFGQVANTMNQLGLKAAAKNFQTAAINATTGKPLEAANAANAGITKLKNAIKKNASGAPATNLAGLA